MMHGLVPEEELRAKAAAVQAETGNVVGTSTANLLKPEEIRWVGGWVRRRRVRWCLSPLLSPPPRPPLPAPPAATWCTACKVRAEGHPSPSARPPSAGGWLVGAAAWVAKAQAAAALGAAHHAPVRHANALPQTQNNCSRVRQARHLGEWLCCARISAVAVCRWCWPHRCSPSVGRAAEPRPALSAHLPAPAPAPPASPGEQVNNAGIQYVAPVHEFPEDKWNQVRETRCGRGLGWAAGGPQENNAQHR